MFESKFACDGKPWCSPFLIKTSAVYKQILIVIVAPRRSLLEAEDLTVWVWLLFQLNGIGDTSQGAFIEGVMQRAWLRPEMSRQPSE